MRKRTEIQRGEQFSFINGIEGQQDGALMQNNTLQHINFNKEHYYEAYF